MTFEVLWKAVKELHSLPDTAIAQIPEVLSEKTKKRLGKLPVSDVVLIVNTAIKEIDRGSVKPLDELILRQIKK